MPQTPSSDDSESRIRRNSPGVPPSTARAQPLAFHFHRACAAARQPLAAAATVAGSTPVSSTTRCGGTPAASARPIRPSRPSAQSR